MDKIALKEWAVAVRAMESGLQDVIFRKGGIQEPEGDFKLDHNEFLLYPAREHQKAQYLKPQFHQLLQETQAAQHGYLVSIKSTAKVKRVKLIKTFQEALPYQARHVWNDDFIKMRLDYKPDRPLYVIELSVTLIDSPLEFVEATEYVGCKSWVNLHE